MCHNSVLTGYAPTSAIISLSEQSCALLQTTRNLNYTAVRMMLLTTAVRRVPSFFEPQEPSQHLDGLGLLGYHTVPRHYFVTSLPYLSSFLCLGKEPEHSAKSSVSAAIISQSSRSDL